LQVLASVPTGAGFAHTKRTKTDAVLSLVSRLEKLGDKTVVFSPSIFVQQLEAPALFVGGDFFIHCSVGGGFIASNPRIDATYCRFSNCTALPESGSPMVMWSLYGGFFPYNCNS
jgi:hypothetical protein